MNRLHEIRANSDTTKWNYVPGEMNPADHCTCYTPFSQVVSKKLEKRTYMFKG